jgi:hypothetical protein
MDTVKVGDIGMNRAMRPRLRRLSAAGKLSGRQDRVAPKRSAPKKGLSARILEITDPTPGEQSAIATGINLATPQLKLDVIWAEPKLSQFSIPLGNSKRHGSAVLCKTG